MKNIFIGALLTFLPLSNSFSQEKIPLEFVSYWAADAEKLAVKELEIAYVERGGEWFFQPINSFDELRSTLLDRINLSIPPDVSQWYGGSDLHQISEIDAIYSIQDVIGEDVILSKLRTELHPDVEHNGELMALPIGVHFQNTAFYSRKIFEELGLDFPITWDDFLAIAPTIKKAGYVPLGSSTTFPFHRRLFNSLLLSNVDGTSFNRLYTPGTSIEEIRQPIEKSFELFFKLRPYTDESQNELLWHEVVREVGKNTTAVTLIGDYAQAILNLDGLNAEEHYYCSMGPGNHNKWSYGMDIFIFPKNNTGQPTKGQRMFAKMMLDPSVQASYVAKKGGISVISDISASPNTCVDTSKWGSPEIELVPDKGSRGNKRITGVNHFVQNAWFKPNYSAEAATDDFIEFIMLLDQKI